MRSASSTLPLSAAAMEPSSTSALPPTNAENPFAAAAAFLRHQFNRLGTELSARVDRSRRLVLSVASPPPFLPIFAAASVVSAPASATGKHAFDLALTPDYVAKTLSGTAVYTVSNSNNEFVLISDPNNSFRSLGILCFRQEDAQTLLAQVKLRQPVLGKGAKVVPITLDQVYMLKVEGIAFRFLPDPLQIKNALALKPADFTRGFDGVPVFQSELLVVKKKNKRYCPIYFQKEDIERELLKASKSARGTGLSQTIAVGSLEDVLKKMEMNDKNSGWDDLIFIPPGKSYSEHINEVSA